MVCPSRDVRTSLRATERRRLMCGREFMNQRSPELPVVCVSVLPEEADFLALGPLAYLVKPFALDDLRDMIAVTLGAGFRAA